jgi:hypothetical protein
VPLGAITYETRLAYSGRVCITASKDFMIACELSEATGNLLWFR